MDHPGSPHVRPLLAGDVPAAMELSTAAGWNQTAADWLRMIELEPGGCFAVDDCDGKVAATATLLCYGRDLAWVGMVLTGAAYQRRGFARRLCEATLATADARGVRCVKLDATDQGRPLYLSLGFVDEQPIERWRREAVPPTRDPQPLPIDWSFDLEAFGADRTRFLRALQFSIHRPGTRARYLGPLIARDPAFADRAVRSTVESSGEPWFWDLFPGHPHAPAIARSLGFAPVRRLMRMVRGSKISTDDSLVYAIGGFEAG